MSRNSIQKLPEYDISLLWERTLKRESSIESKIEELGSFLSNSRNRKSCDAKLLKIFIEFLNEHQEKAKQYFPDIEKRGFEMLCYKMITSYLSEDLATKSGIEPLLDLLPTQDVRDKAVFHFIKRQKLDFSGWSNIADLMPLMSNETWRCDAMLKFSMLQDQSFGIEFLEQAVGMLSDDRNKSNLILQWNQSGHNFDLQSKSGIAAFRQIMTSISDQMVRNDLASNILMAEKDDSKRAQNFMRVITSNIFSEEDFLDIKRKAGFVDKDPFEIIKIAGRLVREESVAKPNNEESETVLEVENYNDSDMESLSDELIDRKTKTLPDLLEQNIVKPRSNFKPVDSKTRGVVTPVAGWETKFFTQTRNNSSR